MTIRSIDTTYAGCRFRSRLEARWVVAFNALGIAWTYEPQGLEVTHRLDNCDTTFRYLPDFWLPDQRAWGEVKGELDRTALTRLLNAAASLSSNNGAGCHDSGGNDLVVFGPLATSYGIAMPARLHMHKGDLIASCFFCTYPCRGIVVADDCDGAHAAADALLRGVYCAEHCSNPRILAALDAARTARFEFGRRGR